MYRINGYHFAFERQPLIRPFHFKGGSFTEKWINVVKLFVGTDRAAMADRSAIRGRTATPDRAAMADPAATPDPATVTGIGGNAVLWSDANVFAAWSQDGGNSLMSLVAEYAAKLVSGSTVEDPVATFESIRPAVHTYATKLTGLPELTPTFSLNAMVAVDLALWKAHALMSGSERFAHLIPDSVSGAFAGTTGHLLRAPLIGYNVPMDEVVHLVNDGHQVLKIKLGQPGSLTEMISKDAARLESLHAAVGSGAARSSAADPAMPEVRYYLDANGRYPDMEALLRLLDRIDGVGILPRIILLEEPFPYETKIDVSDLPVRVAADESLHDVADLQERIDLGYGALALKPAGKTLSFSLLMAAEAAKLGIPCFVADSACVPLLVEWNRLLAAHLPPFPGLESGLIESNGAQNYGNWDQLQAEHPIPGAPWLEPQRGRFVLNDDFFATSGGVFRSAGHYQDLVEGPDP